MQSRNQLSHTTSDYTVAIVSTDDHWYKCWMPSVAHMPRVSRCSRSVSEVRNGRQQKMFRAEIKSNNNWLWFDISNRCSWTGQSHLQQQSHNIIVHLHRDWIKLEKYTTVLTYYVVICLELYHH